MGFYMGGLRRESWESMKAAALVCAKGGLEPLTPEMLDVRVLKLCFLLIYVL